MSIETEISLRVDLDILSSLQETDCIYCCSEQRWHIDTRWGSSLKRWWEGYDSLHTMDSLILFASRVTELTKSKSNDQDLYNRMNCAARGLRRFSQKYKSRPAVFSRIEMAANILTRNMEEVSGMSSH